jgi:DNA-binding NarL/FixJ family response regulator
MTPRILVVEDDAAVAANLGALLTEFGYEFLGSVSEPGAALERARLLHPDLILMDIFFEGAPRGLDLAQRLSQETGARIVFVGGPSDPAVFMRVIHADPCGCVDKPIDPRYLHAVLDRAFRGSATLTAATSTD